MYVRHFLISHNLKNIYFSINQNKVEENIFLMNIMNVQPPSAQNQTTSYRSVD